MTHGSFRTKAAAKRSNQTDPCIFAENDDQNNININININASVR